jgi:2,3,4,5-tetrahydropyridine-2-carboxylate N-succinyltransferase
MEEIKNRIESLWEHRDKLSVKNASKKDVDIINEVINLLDAGSIRVAEKIDGSWTVHQWIKKAVLLSFRTSTNKLIEGSFDNFYDKVSLKYQGFTKERFEASSVRVVPHTVVRSGSFIGANTVLMPSFINIGAYVGEGCMIDTWATVGSCAQIGRNVHISGGVGIGGVLEPLQANPKLRIIALLVLAARSLKVLLLRRTQ